MGGNGTIVIGLRNPDKFRCLSVLAPSCNPISWGQELIYKKFLGDNEELWKTYDACHVIREYKGPQRHILLDAVSHSASYFLNYGVDLVLYPRQGTIRTWSFYCRLDSKKWPTTTPMNASLSN